MKELLVGAMAVLLLAGCAGTPMGDALRETSAPAIAESPPATEETAPELSCKQASKDAMKVSRKNNQGTINPVMIAVIRINGPTVDKSDDPPRNGDFYVCTGTGVFSSGSNAKVKFGYTRKAGQYFTFYKSI
jgi:hypothetical protein